MHVRELADARDTAKRRAAAHDAGGSAQQVDSQGPPLPLTSCRESAPRGPLSCICPSHDLLRFSCQSGAAESSLQSPSSLPSLLLLKLPPAAPVRRRRRCATRRSRGSTTRLVGAAHGHKGGQTVVSCEVGNSRGLHAVQQTCAMQQTPPSPLRQRHTLRRTCSSLALEHRQHVWLPESVLSCLTLLLPLLLLL
mgnify:CR=1 FL=1